ISSLAAKIGKSVSYVDKRLRLLDLSPEIIEGVSNSKINPTIPEELLYVHDENKKSELVNLAQEKHLSSRKVRAIIKDYKESVYDFNTTTPMFQERTADIDERVQRSFNKSITTLKI